MERGGSGRYQMLRKRTGLPWSWSLSGPFSGEGDGERAPQVSAGAFEGGGVLEEDAVTEDGQVAGVDDFAIFENGATEDDVVDLEFAGGAEGVGHGRIDAIDGAGKAVGVGGVVVVVEDLHFGPAQEENAAVAAALAGALDGFGRGPFDVELAVAELLLGADVSSFRNALEGPVADDPFSGRGGFAGLGVGLPFGEGGGGAVEEDDGVGRWLAGLGGGAEGAGLDPRGLRAVLVMDGPRVVGVGGVAVEGRAGGRSSDAERGEQRRGAEGEEGGAEFHGGGRN